MKTSLITFIFSVLTASSAFAIDAKVICEGSYDGHDLKVQFGVKRTKGSEGNPGSGFYGIRMWLNGSSEYSNYGWAYCVDRDQDNIWTCENSGDGSVKMDVDLESMTATGRITVVTESVFLIFPTYPETKFKFTSNNPMDCEEL